MTSEEVKFLYSKFVIFLFIFSLDSKLKSYNKIILTFNYNCKLKFESLVKKTYNFNDTNNIMFWYEEHNYLIC